MPLVAACEIICKFLFWHWYFWLDKGFAFVTMEDQEGVDAAIDKLNGTEIDGQEIKVEQARAR